MKFSVVLVASLFFSGTLAADFWLCSCFHPEPGTDCCKAITGKSITDGGNVCRVPVEPEDLVNQYKTYCTDNEGQYKCKPGFKPSNKDA